MCAAKSSVCLDAFQSVVSFLAMYNAHPYMISHVSTVRPAYMVHGCEAFSDVRYISSWYQSESAKLSYDPDVR